MNRPSVLVVADYYLPGFRAGGPIRAIANSIAGLSDKLKFAVVTRDHDTDAVPYRGVQSGAWSTGAGGEIYYAPRLTADVLERCIRESSAEVIWLNSFFSRASLRVLLARRLGRIAQPIILAPRGELSPGALSLKPVRKALGIWALRRFGFLGNVRWVASSELEAGEIRAVVGAAAVTIVPESVGEPLSGGDWPTKTPGTLRLVFASRIDAKKNLKFLLDVLAGCQGRIQLDIVGPVQHGAYWNTCRQRIERLPANINVAYRGELPHGELARCLSQYDVMALPTLGENFGHIVVEAWAAGCPVLVSDRTPWRNLSADGGGWDLPLHREQWVRALDAGVHRDALEQSRLRQRAIERARRAWLDGRRGADTLGQLVVELARGDNRAPTDDGVGTGREAEASPCR